LLNDENQIFFVGGLKNAYNKSKMKGRGFETTKNCHISATGRLCILLVYKIWQLSLQPFCIWLWVLKLKMGHVNLT